ncbi:MAG: AraC-like DNA-binding protein [Myxococcota bacterium]|jgi:AraC-like DNA-binding protein
MAGLTSDTRAANIFAKRLTCRASVDGGPATSKHDVTKQRVGRPKQHNHYCCRRHEYAAAEHAKIHALTSILHRPKRGKAQEEKVARQCYPPQRHQLRGTLHPGSFRQSTRKVRRRAIEHHPTVVSCQCSAVEVGLHCEAGGYMSAAVTLDRSWTLMLHDLGLPSEDLALTAGIAADLLRLESFRLPVADYFRLIEAADALDPTIALRSAEFASPTAFSPVLFAALCSSSFAVAVDRISVHKRLIAPMSVPHGHTSSGFEVGWTWDDPTIHSPRLLVATELVLMTQIARIGTRERICPVRVISPIPLGQQEAYTDFFGVVPEVGTETRLVFTKEGANKPFLTASEELWQTFEPMLRRRLSKLESETPIVERTQSVLLECLPSGEAVLNQAARRLGMSGRTLQRRLEKEGVSFRQVVQSTRERLAQHYLTHTAIPYGEVAFLLGFDEPSSFFRAFRTWTGSTPNAIRNAG